MTNRTTNNFRNAVGSWTYLASPTMIVDFKLGYNRSNIQTVDSAPPPGWAAFLNSNPVQGVPVRRLNLYPMLLISGFDGPSQFGYPFIANEYQVKGNVSKVKGVHTINAGAELLDMRNLVPGLCDFSANIYRES